MQLPKASRSYFSFEFYFRNITEFDSICLQKQEATDAFCSASFYRWSGFCLKCLPLLSWHSKPHSHHWTFRNYLQELYRAKAFSHLLKWERTTIHISTMLRKQSSKALSFSKAQTTDKSFFLLIPFRSHFCSKMPFSTIFLEQSIHPHLDKQYHPILFF